MLTGTVGPSARERIFGSYSRQGRDPETGTQPFNAADAEQENSNSNNTDTADDSERGEDDDPIVVVRNTIDTAPNLTLNLHNALGRADLYAIAVFGILLQLGFLVYCGFITYYPGAILLKDGDSVANYAFPCTAAGTLALVVGLLICAHVVEHSTSETTYRSQAGREARIVWLQRSETVNDQAFESFAIFPQEAQIIATTSERAPTQASKTQSGRLRNLIPAWGTEELKAVVGALISICGYITQFVGIRGMHWSASLALLVAIGIMTALRAMVRLHLTRLPKAQPLISGHELDWLAMTLGGSSEKAPWLFPSQADGNKKSRPWAAGHGSWEWRVEPTTCLKLTQAGTPDPEGNKSVPLTASKVLRIRKDIGKLADWYGPAAAAAIALARSIEITMDALFTKSPPQSLSWTIAVSGEAVQFRMEKPLNGSWKAYADELEAALSLWLYSVRNKEDSQVVDEGDEDGLHMIGKEKSGDPIRHEYNDSRDDGWLRKKGTTTKPSLHILDSFTERLQQDLRWWMPSSGVRVLEIEECSPTSDTDTLTVESHRVVGYKSGVSSHAPVGNEKRRFDAVKPDRKNPDTTKPILAIESYVTLEKLFAQHLFSVFMWAAAHTTDEVITGGAVVRPAEVDGEVDGSTWRSFTLQNAKLSKLARDIESTGLGTLEDIYLSIIPPLSSAKKLPGADAIVEWARRHVTPHEQLGHWQEVGDAYLWLFRIAKNFPDQSGTYTYTKVTALLIEYLRAVSDAAMLKKAQILDERVILELEQLQSSLKSALGAAEPTTLELLMGLYEEQGRS